MTEKTLHKLRRQDLLQLLLSQSKDVAQQQDTIESLQKKVDELQSTYDRLKAKLDDKDEQIERLKVRLDLKDAQIRHLEESGRIRLNADGTVEEAALRLSEIFEVAQNAANEYLRGLLGGAPAETELPAGEPETAPEREYEPSYTAEPGLDEESAEH